MLQRALLRWCLLPTECLRDVLLGVRAGQLLPRLVLVGRRAIVTVVEGIHRIAKDNRRMVGIRLLLASTIIYAQMSPNKFQNKIE